MENLTGAGKGWVRVRSSEQAEKVLDDVSIVPIRPEEVNLFKDEGVRKARVTRRWANLVVCWILAIAGLVAIFAGNPNAYTTLRSLVAFGALAGIVWALTRKGPNWREIPFDAYWTQPPTEAMSRVNSIRGACNAGSFVIEQIPGQPRAVLRWNVARTSFYLFAWGGPSDIELP